MRTSFVLNRPLSRAARAGAIVVGLLLSTISPAKADSLRYLADADQALVQMTELIRTADRTVDLTYYILDPCAASTKTLLALLQKKASGGVRVRIAIDALTHDPDLQKKFRQYLADRRIELRYFNRARYTPGVNFRTHAKVMIADGRRYISGGRNIADDYFGLNGFNFIDRDVYVEGRSAANAQAEFDAFWNGRDLVTPAAPVAKEVVDEFARTCMRSDEKMKALQAAVSREKKAVLARTATVQCSNVKFTFDDPRFRAVEGEDRDRDSGPGAEYLSGERLYRKKTTREMLKFLTTDVRHLLIENWSYIPPGQINAALRELRARNVPIVVVTNHTSDMGGSIDYLNQHYSRRDNRGSQRIIGVDKRGSMSGAWSQTPKPSEWAIHSKVYVTNFRNVAVTSFNLDPRSYHTNIETGVFVRDCEKFADQVLGATAKLMKAHMKDDRACAECGQNPQTPFLEKLKAWLGHELM